ncbi:MAG: hypothetical protein PHN38_06145 [Sulfurospirillaceae bacterium]|nr:hypothetical protein [Sulfurospirillaceae bacterium]
MSSFDKSLEKIDVIKFLIYLMAFIIIFLSMTFFLIVPNIKEYRAQQSSYKKAYVQKTRVQNVLSEREDELKKLKTQNRKVLESFAYKFNSEDFISYASGFFSKVKLVEVAKGEFKKEFTEYELDVTSSLKTPTNFYNFLEGLNGYMNIIQVDFPIHLESDQENISSIFKIKVYDLNTSF